MELKTTYTTDAGDVATIPSPEPYCQLCGSIAAVVADHPAGPLYYCQRKAAAQ